MTDRPMIAGVAAMLLSGAVLGAQLNDPTHETTTPDTPGLTAATSLCRPSTDATYGMTLDNPVKTGGGDLYLASREVKFLSALRGPAGESVHFKRGGSLNAPDHTILDAYTVDIKGGKSITIYIDGYHWTDPLSPAGFLCGSAMGLVPPGPDPFETSRQQLAIAIELGARDVEPMSLDADGSKRHGVVYDHARLIGLAARSAAAEGKPLDPTRLPQGLSTPALVVIAMPLACGSDMIAPATLKLTDASGNEPPSSRKATGESIAGLSPGLAPTANAIAVVYSVPVLIPGSRVTVHYTRPCDATQDVVLPVTFTPARIVAEAPAPVPEGRVVPTGGARVVLQLFVAADGTALYPAFASGVYEFTDAAIESLKHWRFEPTRANGAQVIQPEHVAIVVR